MVDLENSGPSFERVLILEWYDGVVHGVAHSAAKDTWFLCWQLTWSLGARKNFYAVRPVSHRWTKELFSYIHEPPRWPNWVPRLGSVDCNRLQSFMDQLFIEDSPRLVVGRYSDLSKPPDICCEVVSQSLGRFARPCTIEQIAEQTAEERSRIESICGKIICEEG